MYSLFMKGSSFENQFLASIQLFPITLTGTCICSYVGVLSWWLLSMWGEPIAMFICCPGVQHMDMPINLVQC